MDEQYHQQIRDYLKKNLRIEFDQPDGEGENRRVVRLLLEDDEISHDSYLIGEQ